MAHLAHDPRTARYDRTPPEWLPFGKQAADMANEWAARDDIISFVGRGAVQDEAGNQLSLACFRPDIAEMELAVDLCFGETKDPRFLPDFTKRSTHFEYPEVAGAILHESMHARHTRFDLKAIGEAVKEDPRLGDLIMWFEEIRIEARGIEHYPRNRAFLRAISMKFIIDEITNDREKFDAGGAMSASFLAILGLGRVDGGVLDHADVMDARAFVVSFFGEELLEKLQSIWLRALGHRNDAVWEPLHDLAQEWLDLLEEAGLVQKPEDIPDELKQALAEMAEAMAEAAEGVAEDAADEAAAQQVQEAREEEAKARGASKKEAKDAKDAKEEVFGRSTGPSADDSTNSRLARTREPSQKERGAAIRISKLLERAKYQDRVVEKKRSELPPGRLNGRAAMQRDVQLSQGRKVTAEPWTYDRRFHTQDPELKIGLMTDISGSMSSAMEPMAVLGWVMSEAAKRVQGRIAQVYYGNGVFPVLRAGRHLDKVQVYTAPDGTERFNKAFKALDGELNLLQGSGARLLVIASDMCYTSNEQDAVKKWIKRCEQAGVGVVSLPFTYSDYVEDLCRGTSVEIVKSMDPVAVAQDIGRAAVKALERAGNRVQ